jgi:DNA-binding transcriptional ArsR family regulator
LKTTAKATKPKAAQKKAPSGKATTKKAASVARPASSRPAKRARKSRALIAPDPRIVKALAHPVRMRILARLNEEVLSPVELAEEMGDEVSLALVSYHVKTLRHLGCIELVKRKPVRGALQHFYRATRRAYLSEEDWAQIPLDRRQAITGAVLQDAVSDALEALQTGDMDRRDDRHVTFTTLNLDERAWEELNGLLDQVIEDALRLQAESAGRAVTGEEQTEIRSRLTMLHYTSVPSRPSTGGERRRKSRKRT